MDPGNVAEFRWALEGEERLTVEVERLAREAREKVATDPSSILDDYDVPESDRKVLQRDDVQAVIRESILEETRNGVFGWVDDDICFTKPWGFDPACIAVPVRVEYGRSDVLVPPQHGEWIARRVPRAEVVVRELGHLGDPDADLVERHAWLTAG
jgi:pimeloyl-ACP methyl ester carboxylesterase